MPCPVCHGTTTLFETGTVLNRHRVDFLRCGSCGFIHIENPVWLEDAYASAITASDTGLMERNRWFAQVSAIIIALFFNADGRFIDYGGGEGIYTNMMRQAGYNFFWYDKFAENLHSSPFAADLSGSIRYELLTAVELFEHLPDPLASIADMFRLSPAILFTTHLLPDPPPPLGQWWYYALEHGQHVSFYSRQTLQHIADRFGKRLSTNGRNLHLLSTRALPDHIFRLLTSPSAASLVEFFTRRAPLAPGSNRLHPAAKIGESQRKQSTSS